MFLFLLGLGLFGLCKFFISFLVDFAFICSSFSKYRAVGFWPYYGFKRSYVIQMYPVTYYISLNKIITPLQKRKKKKKSL